MVPALEKYHHGLGQGAPVHLYQKANVHTTTAPIRHKESRDCPPPESLQDEGVMFQGTLHDSDMIPSLWKIHEVLEFGYDKTNVNKLHSPFVPQMQY